MLIDIVKDMNLRNTASVDLEFWNGMIFLLRDIKCKYLHPDFQELAGWYFRGLYEYKPSCWRHWSFEFMEHGVWIKSNVMMCLLSDPKRNKFRIKFQKKLPKDFRGLYTNRELVWCCWRNEIYSMSRKLHYSITTSILMYTVSKVFGTGNHLDVYAVHISPGHSGQGQSRLLQTGKRSLAMATYHLFLRHRIVSRWSAML